MLAMTIKLYGLYQELRQQSSVKQVQMIELKSDRRMYLIHPDDIIYIQGLGNYITIKLTDKQILTSYTTMKNIMDQLPIQFLRVHKSYIINKKHLVSYNNEDIQIDQYKVPRGKGITDQELHQS